MSGGSHPTSERLQAYALGRCDPAEEAELEVHFETCAACCRELETAPLDEFGAAVRALEPLCAKPGQLVAGYELLEEIGSGGGGVVYLARQIALQRVVALKRLRNGVLATAETRIRFRREAELLASLRHPQIVQVLDFGEHLGEPFLVMEYVPGWPLSRILQAAPLAPREAARLLASVARALQEAHDRDVIHRDLKPCNLLLPARDHAAVNTVWPRWSRPTQSDIESANLKVVDFGLAKQINAERSLTRSGMIMGTPGYLAPEQVTDAGGGDARVDVYGLGATLYECLTGRPPFQAATAIETLQQVCEFTAIAPRRLNPRIPRDLQTICMKCLEKNPQRRYARIDEVAEDLERHLNGRPIAARPVSPARRAWLWSRRRPAAAVLSAMTVACLLLLGVGAVVHQNSLQAEVKRTASQRDEAERQRQRADANYQRARDALRSILRQASQHGTGVPRLLELTRRQAEDAVAFLDDMTLVEQPPAFDVLRDLRDMHTLLGNVRMELGEVAEARASFHSAHERAQQLYRQTGEPNDLVGYAASRIKLGVAWRAPPADPSRARVEFVEALRFLEPADGSLAENASAVNTAAWCRHNFAELLIEEGDLPNAAQWCSAAMEARLKLADAAEGALRQRYLATAADSAANLGLVLVKQEQFGQAEEVFARAESMLRDYLNAPGASHEKLTIAAIYVNWSNLLAARGEHARAIELATRGVALVQPLHELEPNQAEVVQRLVSLRGVRAQALMAVGDLELAAEDWKAIPLLSPESPLTTFCNVQWGLIQVRLGHVDAALDVVARVDRNCTADDRYNLACILALAAQQDAEGDSDRSTQCKVQAMNLLQQLAESGYFRQPPQNALLEQDTDLDALRGHRQFQQLMQSAKP